MNHDGGVIGCLMPLGPSIEGMGFRRAFATGIRGAPCMTRGSFIREGSSLAGTASSLDYYDPLREDAAYCA